MINIQSISNGLKLGEDGIWYSVEAEDISYPEDGNESCFSVEDNSFWFKHRNNCISSVVKSFPPENNGAIFDIGGGNGFVSLNLAREGFDTVLVEPGIVGAIHAKERGVENVICATTDTAKFIQNSFPAVGLFDVIEHIDDDLSFLISIRKLMDVNARMYLTVPSYKFLWSKEDLTAGHFRRYSLDSISTLLKSAGFEVEFSSYIFRFLPLPIFLFRALPYRLGYVSVEKKDNIISRDHGVKGGAIINIIDRLLKAEIRKLDCKKSMSFGGSCLVVARKL